MVRKLIYMPQLSQASLSNFDLGHESCLWFEASSIPFFHMVLNMGRKLSKHLSKPCTTCHAMGMTLPATCHVPSPVRCVLMPWNLEWTFFSTMGHQARLRGPGGWVAGYVEHLCNVIQNLCNLRLLSWECPISEVTCFCCSLSTECKEPRGSENNSHFTSTTKGKCELARAYLKVSCSSKHSLVRVAELKP